MLICVVAPVCKCRSFKIELKVAVFFKNLQLSLVHHIIQRKLIDLFACFTGRDLLLIDLVIEYFLDCIMHSSLQFSYVMDRF